MKFKKTAWIYLLILVVAVSVFYIFPVYSKVRPESWAKSDKNFVANLYGGFVAGDHTELSALNVRDINEIIGHAGQQYVEAYLRQRKSKLVLFGGRVNWSADSDKLVLAFLNEGYMTFLYADGKIRQIPMEGAKEVLICQP